MMRRRVRPSPIEIGVRHDGLSQHGGHACVVVIERPVSSGASAVRRVRAATALAAAVVVLVAAPGWARAGGEAHRVAVVVDLGDEVRTARVSFEGDSITGLEALQIAGFGPVARAYGGQGGAVCSLCDRGCPADSTCLTCGGASYWAYFRAAAGASSYSYSHVGAGATQVHDGDVEAWKWGPGVAPSFVSFTDVWGESTTTATPTAPPTTRPAAPPTVTSAPSSGATSVPVSGGPASSGTGAGGVLTTLVGTSATEPGSSDAGGTGMAGSETGSRSAGDGLATGAGARPPDSAGGSQRRDDPGGSSGAGGSDAASSGGEGAGSVEAQRAGIGDGVAAGPVAPPVEAKTGGSAAGLVGFGAVVAGLAMWILRARNARRRGASSA